MSALVRTALMLALVSLFFVGGQCVGPAARDFYRTAFPPPAYTTGDYSDLHEIHGSAVVMYATTGCAYCERARELLAAMDVDYTELRIDESDVAKADFIKRGGIGVPLLFIGDRRIAGYHESVIREALAHVQPAEGVGLGLERSP